MKRLLPVALCVLLSGCGVLPHPTVRLLTDRPEVTAYVERFNGSQKEYRVEVVYAPSPAAAPFNKDQADVVIGDYLATPQLMDRFEPLGDVVKAGRIDPLQFYAGLLAMGAKDNRQVLLPVSFTLPTVVYAEGNAPGGGSNWVMSLDSMAEACRAFNGKSRPDVDHLGFSPFWNTDFFCWTASLSGARLRGGRGQTVLWETDGVGKALAALRTWVNDVNFGPETENAFAARWTVKPLYRLVSEKRILFYVASFKDFWSIPEERRKDLDFRWLSSASNMIPVADDVLFAGVPRSSRNKKGGKAFLEWFFRPQVQRDILGVNQYRRINVFGVADGFSALKTINERDLPQRYPMLVSHIPPENFLLFPEVQPDDWVELRDQVVKPWIKDSLDRGSAAQTLEKRIEDWQKARKSGKS